MTNDGKPQLIDTGRGYTVKYKGKYLYSSVAPEESTIRKIASVVASEKTLFFIPSIGIGYGIKELLRRIPGNSHILCVEADEALYRLATTQIANPLPQSSRFTLLQTSNPGEPLSKLREIGTWRFRRVTILIFSAGYSLQSDEYDLMARLLDDEIRTFWKNKMTLVRLAPLWIKNIFFNLSKLHEASDLEDLSTDLPVIVVGAGPSIEGSIAFIKKIRRSIILIAVDTAFPILMKESIKPDAILMLESQIVNIHDFISFRDASIPVICDLTSSPVVLRALGSPLCFFASEFHAIALYNRLDDARLLPTKIPALGSVGIAALYCALRITSNSVFVTGLDFAYSGGKTHANGSPFHEMAEISSNRLLPSSHFVYQAIRNRPITRLHDKNGVDTESDLVLASYVRLVDLALGSESERVFDIGTTGLDLQIRRLEEREAADSIMINPGKPVYGLTKAGNGAEPDTAKISSFITNELSLLEAASDCVEKLLESESCPGEEMDESMRLIGACDYAYIHFPDPEPGPVCDKGYLVRLLVSIRHYIEICERAASIH